MGRNMATAINCDMGESYGLYHMGDDTAIMPFITVANVACGFHASDPVVMHGTVKLAKQHGVKVGAHPSLPDLQGFGRREMKMRRDEMRDIVIYQVGALKGFLDAEGMPLNHIKPHGALYGMATRDEDIAQAICDAADVFKVPLYGMAGTLQEKIYTARGHRFFGEFYADLDYDGDGKLIITREHAAVEPDVAVERCRRAITEGVVRTVKGNDIPTACDTICVHSDTPGAVAVARAVRALVDGLSSGRG
jgi:5-oxoprolinase (ATP-hydrolysing) subunit A